MNDFLKDIIEGKGFRFYSDKSEVEEVIEEEIIVDDVEEIMPEPIEVATEEVVEEKIWYTNGEKNRRYVKGEQPEGWTEGRTEK